MKVLWLASWYPSKNDLLTGDFFQRHAHAAALHHQVQVLHIKRDDAIKASIDKQTHRQGQLNETIVLYKPALHNVKGVSALISFFTWKRLMQKEVKEWIAANGKPDLIHVKAAWKAGLIALWCKKKYQIPYLVSEQYTGYFTEAKGLVPTFNWWEAYLLKKIFTNAANVLPVSNYLGKALQAKYGITYSVLDNVINTQIFQPKPNEQPNNPVTLLHVSLLNLQKNPLLLFKGLDILREKGFIFKLLLVAPPAPAHNYLSQFPLLARQVTLLPETNQEALAGLMQQADVLLFPSLFESFGLVGYEAIACGTKVVLSDIEVFKTYLANKPFVRFCHLQQPEDFANAIISLCNSGPFNKHEMHQFVANHFAPRIISKRINEIYAAFQAG
jgi:glycosyltransferase involved in cell wall biosynthesis